MKKLFFAMLLMPLMVLAAEDIEGVPWSFSVDNGIAMVEQANPSSGSIETPAASGCCPVTCIGGGWLCKGE